MLCQVLATKVVCLASQGLVQAYVEDTTRPKEDINDCQDMNVLEVIKAARENLESHELPGRITMLDEIPVNSHGKVDRKRLEEHRSKNTITMEQSLHELWATLTGQGPCLRLVIHFTLVEIAHKCQSSPPLSHSDNFLTSGGDSFSALLLVSQLESLSPLPLPSTLLDKVLTGRFR